MTGEITLNGNWRFGFSETEKLPAATLPAVVPLCAESLAGHLGRNGYAAFRREVDIGGPVRLRVTAGLHHRVLWDGAEVGSSVLPYTREEYDFDAGKDGVHELLIVTDNIPDDTEASVFRAFYDFYGHNGIYEPVTIEPLHAGGIDRILVEPLREVPGRVKLHLSAVGSPPATIAVAFDGGNVENHPWSDSPELDVPDWSYWSPDAPHLHTVAVNGRTAEFGIRMLDWSGRQLLLNGKPVKLLGVNRHEAHPEFGAATPEALIWSDLVAIKKQGFNFIRGSHYPQKEFMLRCADRLGLLVWEEALGWGNREAALQDPIFAARQLEQCRKMVRKSFNHPSVIIWGFLNECQSDCDGALPLVTKLKAALNAADPTRPVTFATCRPQTDKCAGLMDVIAVNTYPDWYGPNPMVQDTSAIGERLDEIAARFPEKPLLISEIGCAALPGDHSGFRWSEEFQADYCATALREIRSRQDFSGIALWQFCDTRTCLTTRSSIDRPRGFNNKGLLTEYRLPKLSWRVLGQILAEK